MNLTVLVVPEFIVLFIPGSILTLGAGFVFANAFGLGLGIVVGTLSVFIGASAGSIVAFLVGRYLLRDWVKGLSKKYAIFEALDVGTFCLSLSVLEMFYRPSNITRCLRPLINSFERKRLPDHVIVAIVSYHPIQCNQLHLRSDGCIHQGLLPFCFCHHSWNHFVCVSWRLCGFLGRQL
jgi:hypothetical protein